MSIFLFVATMVLNNPINTARLKVGTILLSLFFVLPWRRWSNAITVAGLIVGLIIVFPFADLFRLNLDSNLAERVSNTSVINELTDNGDYDAFQMVVNTVAVVEKTGFQFGRQIGGALLFWMPRFIWTDKPMATGQWIAEHMGYGFVNLSAPLWAEFYLDGGWFLIILAFFGYGYLVCTLDRWYAISIHIGETQVISVLVPIYAGYQFFLLRGSLMPAVAYFAPMLLFVVVLSIPIKIRKERFRSDTAA